MPYCYSIQNTDKRYLFPLDFSTKIGMCVSYIDILLCRIQRIEDQSNNLVFHRCVNNKQNITWPLVDTNFMFSCSLKDKIRIHARPCNILYLFYFMFYLALISFAAVLYIYLSVSKRACSIFKQPSLMKCQRRLRLKLTQLKTSFKQKTFYFPTAAQGLCKPNTTN